MALLHPAPVSTSRFTMIAGMLVADASDLGRPGPFGRVYDDACDEGLTLVSQRTGREIVYAVDHVERDREGELMYWDLRPAQYQRVADVQAPHVRVYND